MFQKDGVKEPIIIEYSAQDDAVLVIEGNHRINSAIDLGMEYLPARVVLKKYSKFTPNQLKNTIFLVTNPRFRAVRRVFVPNRIALNPEPAAACHANQLG